jgi:uncharacterized protein YaaR (DUF327 family)
MDFQVKNIGNHKSKTPADKKSKSKSERSEKVGTSKENFKVILDKIQYTEKVPDRPLEDCLSELIDAEEELIKTPNRKNLDTYRNLIKEILLRIQENSVEVITIRTSTRNSKNLTIIKIINEKLDYIAKGLTTQSKKDDQGNIKLYVNPAFNLLQTMSDIRGLLIDLLS